MQIAEAQLTTLPAMGGVALLFTTSDARSRDELRRRVLALQNAYTLGLSGDPAANDPDPETRIETRADYFDEPDGARIEIRAVHQSDVDELRRRLRADIRVMTDQQRCPAHAGGAQSPGNDRSR